jgi:hypothetical protein
MHTVEYASEPNFRSDVYCGRSIAALNHGGRWQVYLDHVLQHNVVFASRGQAIDWLMARVDQGYAASRIDPKSGMRAKALSGVEFTLRQREGGERKSNAMVSG